MLINHHFLIFACLVPTLAIPAKFRHMNHHLRPYTALDDTTKVDVDTINNKAYTADADADWNKFDIYIPKGITKPPLILFVHGGMWTKGTKEDNDKMATKIASIGRTAVMVINYHTSANAKHPTFVEDIAKAFIYASSNPDKMPYDPDKIVIVGHGTGCMMTEALLLGPTKIAPMSAFLATIPFTDKIKGMVGVEGVYDLARFAGAVSMTDLELIKTAYGRARKDWIEASPINILPDSTWTGKQLPKHLLIQSRTDEIVDPVQTTNFFNHLQSNNGFVSLNPRLPGSHYSVLESEDFAKTISDFTVRVTAPPFHHRKFLY